jgi:TPP-dependent pyruvate/acetoin dehydrogenase alpha subunit
MTTAVLRAATVNEPPLPDGLTADAMVALYRQMSLLRKFELAAQIACRKGETPGFLHLYIGEEATAVGVCAHLEPTDWVTSTHRGHGHALAKGMDPKTLMAELYGKRDGCCGGRGGTMHLYDPAIGLFGTNSARAFVGPRGLRSPSSATARPITPRFMRRSTSLAHSTRRPCSSARTIFTRRRLR